MLEFSMHDRDESDDDGDYNSDDTTFNNFLKTYKT